MAGKTAGAYAATVKGVVSNPIIRLAMGIGFVSGIYGCYCLFRMLPRSLPSTFLGLIVGGGIGMVEAMAGTDEDTAEELSDEEALPRRVLESLPARYDQACHSPIAIADVVDNSSPNARPWDKSPAIVEYLGGREAVKPG